jgi:pimeloyl-ACP methyl ester carboxylesterase
MPIENCFKNSDGLTLFYRHFAAATKTPGSLPILCLHGLTRNSRDFLAPAQHLAQHYDVIVPDVRGRGFSDRDSDPLRYQPAVYARDMWELLDHFGLERCVVIGTSMGGVIAMIMAAQQPQRVAGFVLNDIGPELNHAGLQRIASYVAIKTEVRNWDDAIAVSQRNFGAALPDLTPAQWRSFAEAAFRADAEGVPRADYDPAIAQLFGQVDNADNTAKAWSLFAALKQPVLVLRGALSDLFSADVVESMRARHPDLTEVEIPNRGHAPLLDEPESIAAIDAFLRRVAR